MSIAMFFEDINWQITFANIEVHTARWLGVNVISVLSPQPLSTSRCLP